MQRLLVTTTVVNAIHNAVLLYTAGLPRAAISQCLAIPACAELAHDYSDGRDPSRHPSRLSRTGEERHRVDDPVARQRRRTPQHRVRYASHILYGASAPSLESRTCQSGVVELLAHSHSSSRLRAHRDLDVIISRCVLEYMFDCECVLSLVKDASRCRGSTSNMESLK